MIDYPSLDPVILPIYGPLAVRWYGMMYLVAFSLAWWLGQRRAENIGAPWSKENINDLIFFSMVGILIGGRLGSVLIYNLPIPSKILYLSLLYGKAVCRFTGARRSHRCLRLFQPKKQRYLFLSFAIFCTLLTPLGLLFGRLGNFINGELFGRVTDVPWAMIFPLGGPVPRHPSQLYEAALEGLVYSPFYGGTTKNPVLHEELLECFS